MGRELHRLFGSVARLKLLRLFLFNRELVYTKDEIATHTKISKDKLSKELSALKSMEFITLWDHTGNTQGWTLDENYPYTDALFDFLMATLLADKEEIALEIKHTGNIKSLLLSGFFSKAVQSPVDVFIVGDRINQKELAKCIEKLEALVGKELRYTALSTQEFKYRKGVNDRLTRDIFDYPYMVLIDKVGIQ